MKKHNHLTDEQKTILFAIYEKNLKTKGKPDYASIKVELMKLNPPVLITTQAIAYQVSRRKDKSKAEVKKAEQALEQARQEHFEVTGEQPQEFNFENTLSEITPENAPVMLKFYDAQLTKFKLELEQGRYVHIDEVTEEIQKIYDTAERAMNAVKMRLLITVTPMILAKDDRAAQEMIDKEFEKVLTQIEDVIYGE